MPKELTDYKIELNIGEGKSSCAFSFTIQHSTDMLGESENVSGGGLDSGINFARFMTNYPLSNSCFCDLPSMFLGEMFPKMVVPSTTIRFTYPLCGFLRRSRVIPPAHQIIAQRSYGIKKFDIIRFSVVHLMYGVTPAYNGQFEIIRTIFRDGFRQIPTPRIRSLMM